MNVAPALEENGSGNVKNVYEMEKEWKKYS